MQNATEAAAHRAVISVAFFLPLGILTNSPDSPKKADEI